MCHLGNLLVNQLYLPINIHPQSLQIRFDGVLHHIILVIPERNILNDLSRGNALVVDCGNSDGDFLQSRKGSGLLIQFEGRMQDDSGLIAHDERFTVI